MHSGGDEFVILLPDHQAEDALTISLDISKNIESYDFDVSRVKIGISIGAATSYCFKETFEKLQADANKALIDYSKKPDKGRTRLLKRTDGATSEMATDSNINLAYCITRSSVTSHYPFANVWLNCLSARVCSTIQSNNFDLAKVDGIVNEFLKWSGISYLDGNLIKSCISKEAEPDNLPCVGTIDLSFAIVHGLLRAFTSKKEQDLKLSGMKIKFKADFSNTGLVFSDGQEERCLWFLTATPETDKEYQVGSSWGLPAKGNLEPVNASRALLVQIGHSPTDIPLSIFADKIIIDDRPIRGGGLPDFWEATIARLVTQIQKNPNIAVVYIVGNYDHGKKSIEKLKGIESWKDNAKELSYKTAMSEQDIHSASALLTGKIKLKDQITDLIDDLSVVLREDHNIMPLKPGLSSLDRRFLRREIHLNDMSLGTFDGCRVDTIAQAFPLVMEIARRSPGNEIVDQAGYKLKELVDFKVHLANPSKDMIPAFYENEEPSLDEYFKNEFESKTGLFGKAFDETKQLDAVLSHVVDSIANIKSAHATRRAILVIPHEIVEGKEISPLGLVSIRMITRFEKDLIRLNYSYTWRTVEALVGFPYSIYGSAKYGMHLTEMIKQQLEPDQRRFVQMGHISYIAHSLHLFMDDYGQNIARRIIDDASL